MSLLGFEQNTRLPSSGKTKVWEVKSLSYNRHIGSVSWTPQSRRYSFFPALNSYTMLDSDSLFELAKFCDLETERHKA